MIGVPLSPLPEVRSAKEPIKSVSAGALCPVRPSSNQIRVFIADIIRNRVLQFVAAERSKLIIRQIFKLHFIGRSFQALPYTPEKLPDPPAPISSLPGP